MRFLSRQTNPIALNRATRAQAPPDAQNLPSDAYVEGGMAQRTDAMVRALRGSTVKFANSGGDSELVKIRRLSPTVRTYQPVVAAPGQPANPGAPSEIHDVYRVSTANNTVEVEIPQEFNPVDALTRAVDYFTQTPAPLLSGLRKLIINRTQYTPIGGYNAPAHGGSGTINFWDGLNHLTNSDTFIHEMGHIIGQSNSPSGTFEPPGWAEAAKKDGNFPSEYASDTVTKSAGQNYAEDFADTWKGYVNARAQGIVSLAGFRSQFPARTAIVAAIFNRQPRAANPAPDSWWERFRRLRGN
jgi:hypothetical protein